MGTLIPLLLWITLGAWWVAQGPMISAALATEEPAQLIHLLVVVALAWKVAQQVIKSLARILTPSPEIQHPPMGTARIGPSLPSSSEGVTFFPGSLATARHEAAHAVATLASGGSVQLAHIIPSGDLAGQVTGASPPNAPLPDKLWMALVVAMAGNIIDLDDGRYDIGSTNDWLRAWSLASALASTGRNPTAYPGDLTPGAIIEAARAQARSLLTMHADWLNTVAIHLVIKRQLSGEQILQLGGERQ